MTTTSGPIGFGSPTAVMFPDIAVQQQQIQRQQDLIDALRQQSMQPIDGGRGAISWTQGLAKLADTLAARTMQKRADQKSIALGQTLRGQMGPMFGLPATPMGTPNASGNIPGDFTPATGGGDPVSPPSLGANPNPALPSSPAQQPPPPPSSPAAGPYQRGPLSISDSPGTDMMEFMASPDKYWEARNAQIAPVDMARTVQQAQAAMARGDVATASALLQSVQKQNYIAPTNVRAGGLVLDPITHQPVFQSAQAVPGTAIDYADGKPAGMHLLPGAPQALGGAAGAAAAGKAAGETPYELVTVTDAQGNTYQVPKSSIPGIGGGQGGTPAAHGSLNGYYGHGAPAAPTGPGVATGPGGIGVQTGRGPGPQAADATAGGNSANGFNTAIQSGVDAKNAMRAIQNIQTAASGLPTGTGSGAISEIKSGVNAVVGAFGGGPVFDRAQIAKFDEMQKNAATLGSQLASSAAGSNGVTDARLTNALHALPGAHYSPQANQEVALNLKGLQAGALGRAQAAAAWQQQHGANSYPAFQQTWQQAYNPDIYYHLQKGHDDFGNWIASMHPDDRARTMGQYRALKALGGI